MKISIVTVVFNDKKNFAKTLLSVKKQTYNNIEFIVIDGRSTDGTTQLIESNLSSVSTFISEADKGLYDAMNKGKDLATGDFVVFINAGDVFVKESTIEDVCRLITEKEVLYCANSIIYYGEQYSKSPIRHHQAVFFPLSYCKIANYNAEKFKVAAEGDFIIKATKKYKEVFLDIDIVFSKIEGFRVTRFKTLKGIKLMTNEINSFAIENNIKHNKISFFVKSFVKYFAFKLGGMPLVAKTLLNSYQKSTREYDLNLLLKDYN